MLLQQAAEDGNPNPALLLTRHPSRRPRKPEPEPTYRTPRARCMITNYDPDELRVLHSRPAGVGQDRLHQEAELPSYKRRRRHGEPPACRRHRWCGEGPRRKATIRRSGPSPGGVRRARPPDWCPARARPGSAEHSAGWWRSTEWMRTGPVGDSPVPDRLRAPPGSRRQLRSGRAPAGRLSAAAGPDSEHCSMPGLLLLSVHRLQDGGIARLHGVCVCVCVGLEVPVCGCPSRPGPRCHSRHHRGSICCRRTGAAASSTDRICRSQRAGGVINTEHHSPAEARVAGAAPLGRHMCSHVTARPWVEIWMIPTMQHTDQTVT